MSPVSQLPSIAPQIVSYALITLLIWFCEAFFIADSLRGKWKHSSTNLLFVATALPIELFFAGLVVTTSLWTCAHRWGLAHAFPFHRHPWVNFAVCFVLLDLGEYLYHRSMHAFQGFWDFHLVHHTDAEVDVSTTLREHPGETIIRNCFVVASVFAVGAPVGVLLLRQIIESASNIFSHSQLELPRWAEKRLGAFFVLPSHHRVHHHFELPHTDRNFGDVLCIWDRLFGTYGDPAEVDVVFGVDTHLQEGAQADFAELLALPFQEKWRPVGARPSSNQAS